MAATLPVIAAIWTHTTAFATDVITWVDSPGVGTIAVRVRCPDAPRFPEGAPVVVEVNTFFTPRVGFYESVPAADLGALAISYLWPGQTDPVTGASSTGTYDFGGVDSLAALRDVIRFVSGLVPNVDGDLISDILPVVPLTGNVGLYGFSHPGIAATNVLALHGADLPTVCYLVGRENPTVDTLSAVEIGHFEDPGHVPVYNPFYSYPAGYTPVQIVLDYSTVDWIQNAQYPDGRPVFVNPGGDDYILGDRIPEMFGKRFYSTAMLTALRDNGALDPGSWPSDLATPEEAALVWVDRMTVYRYPLLATTAPQLKVLLLFADYDHVQPASDKPHIHQAWDGFRFGAGRWVRLEPDRVYAEQIAGAPLPGAPDNPANAEPDSWLDIESWAYPSGVIPGSAEVFAKAALAEMMDRTRTGNWDPDLDRPLVFVFTDGFESGTTAAWSAVVP